MQPATRYRMGRVEVVKHHVDFADVDPDGMTDLIQAVHARVLDTPMRDGCHFFCPEYTLTAPPGTPPAEFVEQARRVRTLWCRKLNKFLKRIRGRSGLKHLSRTLPQVRRTLLVGGFLVIDGQFYHPTAWPGSATTAK